MPVSDPVTTTVMLALEALLKDHPIAVYEAGQLARDPAHELFGRTRDVPTEYGLLEPDGKLHGATRDAILVVLDGDLLAPAATARRDPS